MINVLFSYKGTLELWKSVNYMNTYNYDQWKFWESKLSHFMSILPKGKQCEIKKDELLHMIAWWWLSQKSARTWTGAESTAILNKKYFFQKSAQQLSAGPGTDTQFCY